MTCDLKPCPFCGGEAETEENTSVSLWEVGCPACCYWAKYGTSKAEAIAAWNTRPDNWQPIETAPKDETEILGFWQYVYPGDRIRTCGQRIISWDADWNGWLDDEGETHAFGALEGKGLFTHWQPLPAPPKETTK